MSDTAPCPKCSQEISTNALECPYCGVIPAKYRSNGEASARSSSPEAPPGSPGIEPSASGSFVADPLANPGLYNPDTPLGTVSGGGGDFGELTGTTTFGNPHGAVTDLMVEHLSKTGPWVTLMAALLFLSAVMVALAAVFGMGGASAAGVSPLFVFVPYAIAGVLYLIFALQLFNFGQAARQVGAGGGIQSIEEALGHQRRFWRLMGIVTLIGLGLMLLALAIGLVAGLALGGAAGG